MSMYRELTTLAYGKLKLLGLPIDTSIMPVGGTGPVGDGVLNRLGRRPGGPRLAQA